MKKQIFIMALLCLVFVSCEKKGEPEIKGSGLVENVDNDGEKYIKNKTRIQLKTKLIYGEVEEQNAFGYSGMTNLFYTKTEVFNLEEPIDFVIASYPKVNDYENLDYESKVIITRSDAPNAMREYINRKRGLIHFYKTNINNYEFSFIENKKDLLAYFNSKEKEEVESITLPIGERELEEFYFFQTADKKVGVMKISDFHQHIEKNKTSYDESTDFLVETYIEK